MVKVVHRTMNFFIAVTIILISPALIPSSLLVKPLSATIVGENLILERRVTIPVGAHWDYEINLLEPPYSLLLNCTMSGEAHFERRKIGSPIVHSHECEELQHGMTYQLRWCVQVPMQWGVKMLKSCTVNSFRYIHKGGAPK